MEVYNNIIETIGNTPLIKLNRIMPDVPATVLVKVESFNPGNSIKDRMAIKMIEDAEKDGRLKPGGTIVEGTSGNTGMGLALGAIAKGYKCIFTTNDKQSKEKIDILKAMGAEVIVCPTNVDADDPRSYYSVARKIAEQTPNSIYMHQYDNLSNRQAHYEQTGPEIWKQTEGKITHFVVGVGTGGTISGVGKYLKEQNPNIQVWGVDTYGSVLKKYHETGEFDEKEIYSYITEGIGEDIIPKNIDFGVIDHFEKVTDKDGATYARQLAKKEGVFSGYSAGSAIAAVKQLKHKLTEEDVVVIVLHDHGSRYVGKIYNDVWMKERGFLENTLPTAALIVENKAVKEFITVSVSTTIKEAFDIMKDYGISQLPICDKQNDIVGVVTETSLLSALFKENRNSTIDKIMQAPFPFVSLDTSAKEISKRINKDTSAVFVKDKGGQIHIITEFDLIDILSTV